MPSDLSKHLPRALAVLFRSSHFGLCVVNPELEYVEVNDAWCEMIDYQRTEVLGKPFLDYTHPEDMAVDEDLSRRLFAGEIPFFDIRKRWLRRDGTTFRGRMLASALHIGDDKSLGIAIIQRDDSSAERIARSVGHDLKNLLLIIQGSAVDMRPSADRDSLAVLEGAVERAKVLAHSLLAAGAESKPDAMAHRKPCTPCDHPRPSCRIDDQHHLRQDWCSAPDPRKYFLSLHSKPLLNAQLSTLPTVDRRGSPLPITHFIGNGQYLTTAMQG